MPDPAALPLLELIPLNGGMVWSASGCGVTAHHPQRWQCLLMWRCRVEAQPTATRAAYHRCDAEGGL